MSGLAIVVMLAGGVAHGWVSASTTAKASTCTVAGVDRPLRELTVAERLDWIWAAMQLLHAGEKARKDKLNSR